MSAMALRTRTATSIDSRSACEIIQKPLHLGRLRHSHPPLVGEGSAMTDDFAGAGPATPPHVAGREQLLLAREQALREQADRLAIALGEVRAYAAQLQRSEEELRRQTDLLRLVLDSIAEGVVIADEKG